MSKVNRLKKDSSEPGDAELIRKESEIDDSSIAPKEKHWKLAQWFRKMNEEDKGFQTEDFDHISALEFDDSGRFLVTGDNSGNVVLLENQGKGPNNAPASFKFFTEFESHWHDFNYVKAEAIDAKINQVKFGPETNDSVYLLITNSKDIKLWRIQDREQYTLADWNIHPTNGVDENGNKVLTTPSPNKLKPKAVFKNGKLIRKKVKPSIFLKIPKKINEGTIKDTVLKNAFDPNIHEFRIENLGVLADKEHFVSADNLRINLWDFNVSRRSYNILDIKPTIMEDIKEVISCLDPHPTQASKLLYGTSIGNIMTCDLRIKSVIDDPAQVFSTNGAFNKTFSIEQETEPEMEQFFEDMVQNITAARYSKGGKYIIARDYLSVKIWDVAMERRPVETLYVHDYLRAKLWDIYSAELFLDSFGLGLSVTGDVITGSYSNYFHILDFAHKKDFFLQAGDPKNSITNLDRLRNRMPANYSKNEEDVNDPSARRRSKYSKRSKRSYRRQQTQYQEETSPVSVGEDEYPHQLNCDRLDFTKKILYSAWHPGTETVALAGQNNVFLYANTN